jgi:aspartate/methionine/tyrosine aminotransferase
LPPPKEVFSCLTGYRAFRYGQVAGEPHLREALAQENKGFSKEHFVITNGASEALDLTLRAIARPGDKILLHTPYYYSYRPLVELNHLSPVYVKTEEGKIDIADFEEKVHDAKAVLINSPSNPTGRIQDIKTLKFIERITADIDIPLISDEVYKDLIYERENYVLSGPHVVTVNSFSKTFSMCGYRVGYLFSNDLSIVNAVIALKTHSSMNTSILSQEMAFHATKVPKKFVEAQVRVWKERRDIIYRGLLELGLELWKPEGAFYVLPKIENSMAFVKHLFEKHKVIAYPGEWFGAPNRVRFSYALEADKIIRGLEIIGKYLRGR